MEHSFAADGAIPLARRVGSCGRMAKYRRNGDTGVKPFGPFLGAEPPFKSS